MFSSLKILNYRLYFIGQAISLCGTWMQTIGQDWLVLELTHSGTQLGVVSALQFLPILLLGPWGGVIVDRFDKRKLLIATQSAAGILALILGVLVFAGGIQMWMVYLLAAGLGLVNVVDNPARQTIVPEMVGNTELAGAVRLNATEVNLARAVGPALSGVVIAAFGIALCFLINAVSYIAVIAMLLVMRPESFHRAPRTQPVRGQLREGLRYVRSHPVLLNMLIMMAVIGMFSYEFSVSLPLLASFTFGGSAGSYAALVAATGVGSVFGSYFGRRRSVAPFTVSAYAGLFGVMLIVSSVMPSLSLTLVALFFVGAFSLNFVSLGSALLQLESAPEMRGRVMSLWTMAFLGSTPIGGPIIGWIGEAYGPRWALAAGGAAAIAAALFSIRMMSMGRTPVVLSENAEAESDALLTEGRTRIS